KTASDALRANKVEYQQLPHFVDDFSEPKNVAESTGPLSPRDVFNMLDSDTPEAKVIEQIQQRAINFQVTPQMVDRMRSNEVPDNVIEPLQAATVKESPPPSGPFAKNAEQVTREPDKAFKQSDVVSQGKKWWPCTTQG